MCSFSLLNIFYFLLIFLWLIKPVMLYLGFFSSRNIFHYIANFENAFYLLK